MTDCNLIQLDNGEWWCPAPGCDDEKKRLLPGNYHRNCRSPEQNAEVKARQERIESYLAVCYTCPEDTFDGPADEGGYCTKHSGDSCQFKRLLVSPMFRCEHWK